MMQALKNAFLEMYERDLLRLREEIAAYRQEENLWEKPPGINNSAGNLVLHLNGNLRHFIGAALGGTGYVRQRDAEFALRGLPRTELLASVDETLGMVNGVLRTLQDGDFEKKFPLDKHGKTVTTVYMLQHLLTHLNYHLGQVNYHRRLVEGV